MGSRYPFLIAVVLLLVACDGCQPFPYVPPQPPKPDPEAGADCARVCQRGAELGCEFAAGNDGETCEEICVSSTEWLDLECLAGMTSCEQQEACTRD